MAAARMEDDRRAEVAIAGHTLEVALMDPESERAPLVFLHGGLGSIDLGRDFPSLICREADRRDLVSRYGNESSDGLVEALRPDHMHEEAISAMPPPLQTLNRGVSVLIGQSDGLAVIQRPPFGAGTRSG